MSKEQQVPYKRIMIIIGIVIVILLMIFANTTPSDSEGISGGSTGGQPKLEKDLPIEKRIPTH